MNALDKFTTLLSLTREPFPASHKCVIPGSRPDLFVPVRDVALTNGETVSLYDTSGPYTDPKVEIDVRRGLPDVRGAWVLERNDTESYEGRTHHALDDGAKNEDRDAQRLAELRPAEQRYLRTLAERKGAVDARLIEYRWLLEELRVSFFAQELRTPQPVSIKRLDKAWEQMTR